jgi:NAD(P)-dependent dehydrogenase (short-subunit alcohol dehydrogenase family)
LPDAFTQRFDVLINNAGLTRNAPTPVTKLDDYDAVAALARGTCYLTKLMLRRFMMKQKSGRIIQIPAPRSPTRWCGRAPTAGRCRAWPRWRNCSPTRPFAT